MLTEWDYLWSYSNIYLDLQHLQCLFIISIFAWVSQHTTHEQYNKCRSRLKTVSAEGTIQVQILIFSAKDILFVVIIIYRKFPIESRTMPIMFYHIPKWNKKLPSRTIAVCIWVHEQRIHIFETSKFLTKVF